MACEVLRPALTQGLGIVPRTISMPLFLKANIPQAPEDREGSVPRPSSCPAPPLQPAPLFPVTLSSKQVQGPSLTVGHQLFSVPSAPQGIQICFYLLSLVVGGDHYDLFRDMKSHYLGG